MIYIGSARRVVVGGVRWRVVLLFTLSTRYLPTSEWPMNRQATDGVHGQ